jgi:hypothetical protein
MMRCAYYNPNEALEAVRERVPAETAFAGSEARSILLKRIQILLDAWHIHS